MRKRISCFLLALVMVLLAIPVFALSTAAAAVPYTTRWVDNMPTIDKSTSPATVLTGQSGWIIGSKPSGSATDFKVFNGYDVNSGGGNAIAPMTTVGGNTNMWGLGGIYLSDGLIVSPTDRNTAVRYVAEYSGAATVSVDSLKLYSANGHGFAILHNGEVVFPKKDGVPASYADENTWFTSDEAGADVSAEIADFELTLAQGDTVDFVFNRLAAGGESRAARAFQPRITYADVSGQNKLITERSSSYYYDARINYASSENFPAFYKNFLRNSTLINKYCAASDTVAAYAQYADSFDANTVAYSEKYAAYQEALSAYNTAKDDRDAKKTAYDGLVAQDPAASEEDIAAAKAEYDAAQATYLDVYNNTYTPALNAWNTAKNNYDGQGAAKTAAAAELLDGYRAYLRAAMPEATRVSYTGAWKNGVIKPDGSFVPVTQRQFFVGCKLGDEAVSSWDTMWVGTADFWTNAFEDYLKNENVGWALWGTDHIGAMRLDVRGVQPTTGATKYAHAYTAPVDGQYSFSFEDISAPQIDMYVGILVDGYMVWPNAGASITDNAKYFKITASDANGAATVNAALASLKLDLLAGSQVQFIVGKYSGGWASSAANSQSFVVKPVVTYKTYETNTPVITYTDTNGAVIGIFSGEVGSAFPQLANRTSLWDVNGDGKMDNLPATISASITVRELQNLGKDALSANMPVLVDGVTQFKGNWTVGNGTWSDTDLTKDGLTWQTKDLFGAHDGWAFVSGVSGEGLWSATGGGMYSDGRFAVTKPTNAPAVIYTAPIAGFINISLDTFVGMRSINNGDARGEVENPIAYNLSILKNGEVIWPSEGSAFAFETKAMYTGTGTKSFDFLNDGNAETLTALPEAFPTNLLVAEGDEIAFVLNMYNDSCWMCKLLPSVSYTEYALAPKATGEAAVALNKEFAAKFFIDEDTVPAGATGLGAYINGDFVAAVDYTATLEGIAAKEIADEITVVPTCFWNEIELKGEELTTSAAELLKGYIAGEYSAETKALAAATLNYAAAAQTYFDYNTENLANADVAYVFPEYEEYASVYDILNTDGKAVDFYGVKLILEDTVKVAVYFKSDADLTGYTAWCESAQGAPENTDNIVSVGNGIYKVIFDGFMPGSWSTTYAFWLTDGYGVPVSGDLQYSVNTYAVRMQNSEVDAVVDAMLVLSGAADAYAEANA